MGVEVVHHQDHFPGVRIVDGQQFFDEVGPVFLGATLRHLEIAFAPSGSQAMNRLRCPFFS